MMNTRYSRVFWLSVLLSTSLTTGCGVQSIPRSKNAVDAAQAEVLNQYQRRADLIPSLVEVVKGAAAQEKDTLEAVMNARAKATQMQVKLSDAASLQKFQQAQSELGGALARLMAVSESYPQLKSMENFRDLQVQLEGTENRITVARQRTIAAIQVFNDQVTVFPTNLTNSLIYHYQPLPQWGADKDAKSLEKAPTINFKK
jgi:LemA protein